MNTVEKAKAIRSELKETFKGVKFSVRTKKYSGGSSISINWTDFPAASAVEEITSKYESISRCEYTGEILSGGNTYIHTYNTWSEDMENTIKENLITKYGIEFYNEHIEGYNYYRYARELFETMYQESIKQEVVEPTTTIEDTKIVLNEELNGVEIHFTNKPSEEVRTMLKENGFRYSRYNKCWYAKQSEKAISFANSLIPDQEVPEVEVLELDAEEKETIIKHAEEYANQILKEEIQEAEELDKYKVIETTNNIFINDISISRKPSSVEDAREFTTLENIVINKYLVLSNSIFNNLCNDFFMDFTPIAHQGGTRGFKSGIEVDYNNYKDIYAFINDKDIEKYSDNILITNEDNTKYIVVNPEGYSYCRYVGILTVSEGTRILKQLKGEVKASNLQVIENNNCSTLEGTSNVELINSIGLEVEALEKRLNMVTSAKLKYKIQCQIDSKMKEVAKIIMSDEILYMQFMKETNQ